MYFAYGSNMNLDQMAYRCPAAEAVCTAKLEGYELFFAGRPGNGIAGIRPKQGGAVEGVLWKLTQACEKSLDHYEGFPVLYGKETVCVRGSDGTEHRVMAYTMQKPYSRIPAMPSMGYLAEILAGCEQNGIDEKSIQHILEQFYQADTSHVTQGNGLGLALVQKIIDLLGGIISVQSTPGVGSLFTVRIRIS